MKRISGNSFVKPCPTLFLLAFAYKHRRRRRILHPPPPFRQVLFLLLLLLFFFSPRFSAKWEEEMGKHLVLPSHTFLRRHRPLPLVIAGREDGVFSSFLGGRKQRQFACRSACECALRHYPAAAAAKERRKETIFPPPSSSAGGGT